MALQPGINPNTTSGASSYSYYYHHPSYQPWPNTTYSYIYPQPISDADVERIAIRVADLLDERAKPKRRRPTKKGS